VPRRVQLRAGLCDEVLLGARQTRQPVHHWPPLPSQRSVWQIDGETSFRSPATQRCVSTPLAGRRSSRAVQCAPSKTKTSLVVGCLWLTAEVTPGMAERGGGSVILMSSIAGIRGNKALGLEASMTPIAFTSAARSDAQPERRTHGP
jgi:hypothetical protein